MNRDPIGEKGGVNIYTHTTNAATIYIDPHGFVIAIGLPQIEPNNPASPAFPADPVNPDNPASVFFAWVFNLAGDSYEIPSDSDLAGYMEQWAESHTSHINEFILDELEPYIVDQFAFPGEECCCQETSFSWANSWCTDWIPRSFYGSDQGSPGSIWNAITGGEELPAYVLGQFYLKYCLDQLTVNISTDCQATITGTETYHFRDEYDFVIPWFGDFNLDYHFSGQVNKSFNSCP